MFSYKIYEAELLDLNQEVPVHQFVQKDMFLLNFNTGQISLRDDSQLYSSGINMRFSPLNFKADVKVWPCIETQLVRVKNLYNHNPIWGVYERWRNVISQISILKWT